MKIDRNKRGDVVVVAPHGSLDIDTRKIFQDMLIGLLNTGETAILVDLSHVDFMTSTGLRRNALCGQASGGNHWKVCRLLGQQKTFTPSSR